MTYTADWTSIHTPTWKSHLGKYASKPNVHGLEIGCFEGRSTVWFLENVLTGAGSTMTVIDTFEPNERATGIQRSILADVEKRFDENIASSKSSVEVIKIVGTSVIGMRELPANHYDFIYVDGSHSVADVMLDMCHAWPLLRRDGLMVLDDYGLYRTGDGTTVLGWEETPRVAIDTFISIFAYEALVVHKAYQVILQKKTRVCSDDENRTEMEQKAETEISRLVGPPVLAT